MFKFHFAVLRSLVENILHNEYRDTHFIASLISFFLLHGQRSIKIYKQGGMMQDIFIFQSYFP